MIINNKPFFLTGRLVKSEKNNNTLTLPNNISVFNKADNTKLSQFYGINYLPQSMKLGLKSNLINFKGELNNDSLEAIKESIPNFKKVDDNYYRGACPDYLDSKSRDIKLLAGLGIKTIIDLRVENEYQVDAIRQKLAEFNINYIRIPLEPGISPERDKRRMFIEITNNSKNLPVFVHCGEGILRTGKMTDNYKAYKRM